MIDTSNPEIMFAIDAARQAALLVRQVQLEMVTPVLTKEDRSPVTVADFASQALISRMLTEAFPEDALVAEEDAAGLRAAEGYDNLNQVTKFVKRSIPEAAPASVCDWIDRGQGSSGKRFWTLDPIDGTKGFLRGDQYAVALALIVDGRVQVAALGCPHLSDAYRPSIGENGSLLVAARDQGSWTTALETPGDYCQLRVSQIENPSQARILRSVESGHTNVNQVDHFAAALGVEADPVRLDSQAKYAVLAAGKGELYLRLLSPDRPDYREKIWDQAAGSLILEEAGGRITDLDGKPLDFTTGRSLTNNRGILASNYLLHSAALSALREVDA
ncbi:MAG: 3'(2'),5'-bisphosphate nucleotidase [Chloroflexota bacterium]|nr:3'(2'),5'-bisphosphate nucleotidase [Chloroflexota bacterium]